jgi:hypothetical protein
VQIACAVLLDPPRLVEDESQWPDELEVVGEQIFKSGIVAGALGGRQPGEGLVDVFAVHL